MKRLAAVAAFCAAVCIGCATRGEAVPAEDYYSVGNAYLELKKYPEAKHYFTLAAKDDKTRAAAEYQLARIQYASGDAAGAAASFEKLLEKDPKNTTVLCAAAYSWMTAKEFDKAILLFQRIEEFLPESKDARYNYGLALAETGKLEESIEKVLPYAERVPDDRDAQLLLARTERKLGRPEAIDRYAAALSLKDEAAVRSEYVEALESNQLYAKAVEQYDILLGSELPADPKADKAALDKTTLDKATLRFRKARALLIASDDRDGGLDELKASLDDGFKDKAALESLLSDDRVPVSDDLRAVVDKALAALPSEER